MSGIQLTESALALVIGDLVGAICDRLITTVDKRVKLLDNFKLVDGAAGSLLDAALGVFLHLGTLSVGTHFASNALPMLTADPAAFAMFIMGITATSPHLFDHLRTINSIILNEALYDAAAATAANAQPNAAAAASTSNESSQ
jgi:hypothetical protein